MADRSEAGGGSGGLTPEQADRTGLIREAYRIEGITEAECRSIFLDWALKLEPDLDSAAAIRVLIARYGATAETGTGHPMTAVLHEALAAPGRTGRRGGWRGRPR
jgi:hypothetical protein